MKTILSICISAVLLLGCATQQDDQSKSPREPYTQDDVTRVIEHDKKGGILKAYIPEGGFVEVDPRSDTISFFEKGKDYPIVLKPTYTVEVK